MIYISKLVVIFFIFVVFMPFFACKPRIYEVENIENKIGELTIFTYDGKGETKFGLKNLGHSFLSIKNTSTDIIKIGDYSIEPDETICVGSWSIFEHFGVWYNVESNYIDVFNKYDGRISVTKDINEEDVLKICEFIANHDVWNPIYNCSAFAINLWNSVARNNEFLRTYLIYKPAKLAKQLKSFSNYEINKEIVTKNTFGYFADSYVSFSLRDGAVYV